MVSVPLSTVPESRSQCLTAPMPHRGRAETRQSNRNLELAVYSRVIRAWACLAESASPATLSVVYEMASHSARLSKNLSPMTFLPTKLPALQRLNARRRPEMDIFILDPSQPMRSSRSLPL